MEGIAGVEASAQELSRLGLSGGRVHRSPFWRQLSTTLKAPVGITLSHAFPQALVSQVLEQTPSDHLADLGLIVGDEILRDSAHDLGNPLLPLKIPVSHL